MVCSRIPFPALQALRKGLLAEQVELEVDNAAFKVYSSCKVPFARAKQALGMDTWPQPFHDTIISMASLLYTLEVS